MKNIVKLRIAMEQADDEWKAAVKHAIAAPTPDARVQFDVKAETLFNRYWSAFQAYKAAVVQEAAEQERNDPEGIQINPRAVEIINA